MSRRADLRWNGPIVTLDGVEVQMAILGSQVTATTDERFVVWKNRPLLMSVLRMVDRQQARRIVELGIAQGGSVALLALYADPEHFVAIDCSEDPIGPLEKLIDERGLRDRVHTCYGVDQADRRALLDALGPLAEGSIDLVLDDASHRYDETVASFDLLFPRLRPGGVYAIEDWDWGHQDVAVDLAESTDSAAWFPGGTPLTRLAFELVLATADPQVVESVQIDRYHVRVTRGPAELDPDTFRLHDHVSPRGQAMLAADD